MNNAEYSAFSFIGILKRSPRGKHADWSTENILKRARWPGIFSLWTGYEAKVLVHLELVIRTILVYKWELQQPQGIWGREKLLQGKDSSLLELALCESWDGPAQRMSGLGIHQSLRPRQGQVSEHGSTYVEMWVCWLWIRGSVCERNSGKMQSTIRRKSRGRPL